MFHTQNARIHLGQCRIIIGSAESHRARAGFGDSAGAGDDAGRLKNNRLRGGRRERGHGIRHHDRGFECGIRTGFIRSNGPCSGTGQRTDRHFRHRTRLDIQRGIVGRAVQINRPHVAREVAQLERAVVHVGVAFVTGVAGERQISRSLFANARRPRNRSGHFHRLHIAQVEIFSGAIGLVQGNGAIHGDRPRCVLEFHQAGTGDSRGVRTEPHNEVDRVIPGLRERNGRIFVCFALVIRCAHLKFRSAGAEREVLSPYHAAGIQIEIGIHGAVQRKGAVLFRGQAHDQPLVRGSGRIHDIPDRYRTINKDEAVIRSR